MIWVLAPKNHVRVKDARQAVKRRDTLHVKAKQITQRKNRYLIVLIKWCFIFFLNNDNDDDSMSSMESHTDEP